jgi:hypothetical protein
MSLSEREFQSRCTYSSYLPGSRLLRTFSVPQALASCAHRTVLRLYFRRAAHARPSGQYPHRDDSAEQRIVGASAQRPRTDETADFEVGRYYRAMNAPVRCRGLQRRLGEVPLCRG